MYKVKEILNTVIQGDTIEELKKIPSNSIDMILVDPLYLQILQFY